MNELLSAFGIKWELLLAQAVNFGIVLLALTYFLYKPVLAALDKRQAFIKKGIEEAEQARALFSRADAQALERVTTAETEAEKIVSSAREMATSEKTRLVKEAEARALALTKDAEVRASEAAAKALRESEKEVARLAILAAEKVMSSSAKAS